MKITYLTTIIIVILSVFSCSEKTTQPYSDTVATPVFSLASGIYMPQRIVTLTCSTPQAIIRYTTDGSEPDKHSMLYSDRIEIDSTQVVKAIAYRKGWNQSALASAEYEIYQPNIEAQLVIYQITSTPDSIYADNGLTETIIKAKVRDSNALGVQGQLVKFNATLGTIAEEAITDEDGIATAIFKAGTEVGLATVSATISVYHPQHPEFVICYDSLSTSVRIMELPPVPQNLHTIQFMQSGQIDLNVINTGGVSSALLKVRLLDENNNLVIEPKNVWFKIIGNMIPAGANLGDHNAIDSVLAVSVNGIAQVMLNSGTGSGKVSVKASCTSAGHYFVTDKSNLVIHSGPPHRIVPFAGGYNTGVNLYVGLWGIVAGAYVYDIYNNPVDYGTSVWFYLPDNQFNCQIGANAYVGNESVTGDSTAGVAYTTLTYSGYYSTETITIRAVTGGINGQEVIGEGYVILPLNQPQLELEIIPGNMVFHGNTNTVPPSAIATLNASVFDSQGCSIHNTRIIMTSTHGMFEPIHGTNRDPLNCNPYNSPNIIVTDWYYPNAVYEWYYDPIWQIPGGPDIIDGGEGLAQGSIRFYEWEIPLGDPLTGKSGEKRPGVTTATIYARLIGTDVTANASITLIRYPS